MVTVLIRKGADVNLKTNSGETPLHFAAFNGNKEIFFLLIENGADMTVKDNNGHYLIHDAVLGGELDIVKKLIDYKQTYITALDDENKSPLYYAAKKQDKAAFNYLIQKGADINLNSNGTLLHTFTKEGNLDAVHFLIENGADINAKWEKDNFFTIAVEYGKLDIVKYLDEKKYFYLSSVFENSETKEKHNSSLKKDLVCTAVRKGQLNIIRYFNIPFEELQNACNPLLMAAFHGYLDVVMYYINEKGVDINHTYTFQNLLIEDEEVQSSTAICYAAIRDHLDVLKFFKDKGTNFNEVCSPNGNTPARVAIYFDRFEIFKFFMQSGVSPHIKDQEGETLLMRAARKGNLKMVKYLVEEEKVNPEAKSNSGLTALQIAAGESEDIHRDVVSYLLELEPNQENKLNKKLSLCSTAKGKTKEMLQDVCNRYFRRSLTGLKNTLFANRLFGKEHPADNLKHPKNVARGLSNQLNSVSSDDFIDTHRNLFSYISSSENTVHTQKRSVNSFDLNGTLLLLDTFIRLFRNKRHYSFQEKSTSALEVKARALRFVEKFEQILTKMLEKSTVENIDFSELHGKVHKAIMSNTEKELMNVLCSFLQTLHTHEHGESRKFASKPTNVIYRDENYESLLSEATKYCFEGKRDV